MTPQFCMHLMSKLLKGNGRALMLWIRMLSAHAFLFYALYAWKVMGVGGAGNLLQFFVGILIGCSLLVMLAPAEYDPDYESAARASVGTYARLAICMAMAWFGEIAMATAFLAATAIMALHRSRCLEARPRAEESPHAAERKA